MNKSDIPYIDFVWNPCGYGCSHGCPTCWARRLATQGGPTSPTCPECRRFAIHVHPERLEWSASPAGRRKPAVVGVQFTGELFDTKRPIAQQLRVLDLLLGEAPQHTAVLLTRQYERARSVLAMCLAGAVERRHAAGGLGADVYAAIKRQMHVGTTCTTQAEYDLARDHFGNTIWGWWVSAEPLHEAIVPKGDQLPKGIIIGADNVQSADCGVDAIRATADAFVHAGVKVYVKQLWMWRCPDCSAAYENARAVGPSMRCSCGVPAAKFARGLARNLENFPPDLNLRQLPWTLTRAKKPHSF